MLQLQGARIRTHVHVHVQLRLLLDEGAPKLLHVLFHLRCALTITVVHGNSVTFPCHVLIAISHLGAHGGTNGCDGQGQWLLRWGRRAAL